LNNELPIYGLSFLMQNNEQKKIKAGKKEAFKERS
jgi:hypothetical protein